MWSDETKTELCEGEAFNPKNTKPTVKHGAGSIMLQGCLAASGSAALKKANGTTKEDYLQNSSGKPKII